MPDDSNPLVSVVCIAYNHAAYIRDAIEGFLRQDTTFTYEILVHDDASTDETLKIVKEYAALHPGVVRCVAQPFNIYSKGIKPSSVLLPMCLGQYIAYCEGDDYWTDPKKLEKQVAFMARRPDCAMSFHPALQIFEDSSAGEMVRNRRVRKPELLSDREVILGRGNFYPTASAMFRKSEVIEHFLALSHLQAPGDHLLGVAALCGGSVRYMDECMAVFRRNAGSVTQAYKYRMSDAEKAAYRNINAAHTLRAFEFIDHYTHGRFSGLLHLSRRLYLRGWMSTNIGMLSLDDALALNAPYYRELDWVGQSDIALRTLVKRLGLRWRR